MAYNLVPVNGNVLQNVILEDDNQFWGVTKAVS